MLNSCRRSGRPLVRAALTFGACVTVMHVGAGAASAETFDAAAGDSVVAARFQDRCDGDTEVRLVNPHDGELLVTIDDEQIVVPAQGTLQRSVRTSRRGRPATVRVVIERATGARDRVLHTPALSGACAPTGSDDRRGRARAATDDVSPVGHDAVLAARFRDRCDGGSDVQLPNPYTFALEYDLNGQRVQVSPHQQVWRSVDASPRHRDLTVEVRTTEDAATPDLIEHEWRQPSQCD